MFSLAAKRYQKTLAVRPLNTMERQRVYQSCSVKVDKKQAIYKDSSFDTIDRTKINSFLLRSHKQMTNNVNYSPKFEYVQHLSKRPTIDKAKFVRIIGPIKNQDFSVQINPESNHRCLQAMNSININARRYRHLKPLLKDTQSNKQIEKSQMDTSMSNHDLLKDAKSTQISFLKSSDVLELNKPRQQKKHQQSISIHSFQSYSGHQFLKEINKKNIAESFVGIPPIQPKGYVKFGLFRDLIIDRNDRIDPYWNSVIQDKSQHKRLYKSIDIGKLSERKPNQVHSRYPIRLSLTKIIDKPN